MCIVDSASAFLEGPAVVDSVALKAPKSYKDQQDSAGAQ